MHNVQLLFAWLPADSNEWLMTLSPTTDGNESWHSEPNVKMRQPYCHVSSFLGQWLRGGTLFNCRVLVISFTMVMERATIQQSFYSWLHCSWRWDDVKCLHISDADLHKSIRVDTKLCWCVFFFVPCFIDDVVFLHFNSALVYICKYVKKSNGLCTCKHMGILRI